MKSFFASDERRAALRTAAQSWLGTPFFPHSRARGAAGGVDCVNLVAALLVECGQLDDRPLPKFPMDWADHHAESAVVGFFSHELADRFQAFDAAIPMPGDVLCFQLGRCIHHIGLALSPTEFVHALQPLGVIRSGLNERVHGIDLGRRLVRLYRPLDPAS